jgi:hypothetical protein
MYLGAGNEGEIPCCMPEMATGTDKQGYAGYADLAGARCGGSA